jgi:succinoglycan biosynthesis protein ExoV
MKLYYYKGAIPNFGDDLNAWLWPKLIPDVLNDTPDDGLLVGIGTLINTKIPPAHRVVIFSSGCGYGDLPKEIPQSWHFYGVRGPISAQILGLSPDLALGDGAILVRTLRLPKSPVHHAVSFMPHWESAVFGAWPKICQEAGINFIDPRDTVENVLDQIRGSEKMLCASMHGAILADAFRVPWVAVRAFGKGHVQKWSDWAGALDMDVRFAEVPASSIDEMIHDLWPRLRNLIRRMKLTPPTAEEKTVRLSRVIKSDNRWLIQRSACALSAVAKMPAQLSSDTAMERVTHRLLECVARLQRDYAGGFADLKSPF